MLPILGIIFAVTGAAMFGAMTYENSTNNHLVDSNTPAATSAVAPVPAGGATDPVRPADLPRR